jgi:hypothetical protein
MDHGPVFLMTVKPLKLRFVHDTGMAPEERLMEEVTQWCKDSNCGRRTAYDTFEFKSKQEVLLFTLRWG